MYRNISDFLTDWKYETESTDKLFKLLTEATSSQQIHENVRSLKHLARHLTQTLTEMGQKAGLFTSDELEHTAIPTESAVMLIKMRYCLS
jgi:uncharacterized damage-inducible protein DinB